MKKLWFLIISYMITMAFCYIFTASVVETFDPVEWEARQNAETVETVDGEDELPLTISLNEFGERMFITFAFGGLLVHVVLFIIGLAVIKDHPIEMGRIIIAKGERGLNIFRWLVMFGAATSAGLLSWRYVEQTVNSVTAQILLVMVIVFGGIWVVNIYDAVRSRKRRI